MLDIGKLEDENARLSSIQVQQNDNELKATVFSLVKNQISTRSPAVADPGADERLSSVIESTSTILFDSTLNSFQPQIISIDSHGKEASSFRAGHHRVVPTTMGPERKPLPSA